MGGLQQEADRRLHSLKGLKERNSQEAVAVRAQLDKLQAESGDLSSSLTSILDDRNSFQAKRDALREAIASLRHGLEDVEAKLLVKREAFSRQASRLESLEQLERSLEGYGRGVKALLSQPEQKARLHGVVADVLEVPPAYEVAVEAVLGSRLQAVLADQTECVEAAIAFLRQGEGRCTFLLPGFVPAQEAFDRIGTPLLDLELSASRPVAMVAARLSDVRPDGKATRVTYGLLNLTHRDGSAAPRGLAPDRPCRVRIRLNGIAQRFPAGHRLRLALSTSYWPLAWPPPQPVQLSVHTGPSRLKLPARPRRDEPPAPFDAPETAPPLKRELIEPEHHNWRVIRDLADDSSLLEVINDGGTYRIPVIDLQAQRKAQEWYSCTADDFASVRGETLWTRSLSRPGWSIRTVTRTVLTSDPTHFFLHAELDAWEGDARVFSRNWNLQIPRDGV